MIMIVVLVAGIMCVAVIVRTKCSSVFVVMMRATSKENMRTEGDKRYTMNEAS
jgi:hypothetical protein